MEIYEREDRNDQQEKEEIFSKSIRAGKRTYFFDVRTTRRNEYYLTITESKKRMENDGRFYYEKHKIFLYQEDFEKFVGGLEEIIDYIRSAQIEDSETELGIEQEADNAAHYSNVEFEDLAK